MAIFFDAPVTPDALTAFIRRVPFPGTLTLSAMFPTETSDTNTIDWAEVTSTNRTARFRSFDGRIHVSERDGAQTRQVRLLPLSDASPAIGEYERLQQEFARTGGTFTAGLERAIYNDGERLVRNVRNRMEQAIGDVLVDGKLTINENGFSGEADFGVPGGHLVTAGTAWTNAAAPILDNLISWVDTYVAANGFAPGGIITSQRVQRLMRVNTQLINTAAGAAVGRTRINLDELNDVLTSEGLPTGITLYDSVLDVDGVSTRVIPDDRVIFLPPNPDDLLAVRYGVSATALELINSLDSDFTFGDAPGIVGVVDKNGQPPYREQVFVDAVGMPYLKDGRKLFVADVA